MVVQLSDKTFGDLLEMIPEARMKKWVQSSSFTILDNSTRSLCLVSISSTEAS